MPLINYIGGGSGGIPQLPEQIENFYVEAGTLSAILTWTPPEEDQNSSFVGTLIVRKEGVKPESPTDGTVVYEGTDFTYTDEGLTEGTTYYYRAFAYNAEGKYQTSERCVSVTATNSLSLSELPEGALLTLNENGVAAPFYVAKHDYESGLNGTGRTLLVRKDCLANREWHSSSLNTYASSTIDNWLNTTYKTSLDEDIQTLIGTTEFYYTPGNGNDEVDSLSRAIFLLSVTELGKSFTDVNVEGSALSIADTLQIAYRDGYESSQWTRTPKKGSNAIVWLVYTTGAINTSYCTGAYGVRPCFTLPAAELIVSATPDENGYYSLL